MRGSAGRRARKKEIGEWVRCRFEEKEDEMEVVSHAAALCSKVDLTFDAILRGLGFSEKFLSIL